MINIVNKDIMEEDGVIAAIASGLRVINSETPVGTPSITTAEDIQNVVKHIPKNNQVLVGSNKNKKQDDIPVKVRDFFEDATERLATEFENCSTDFSINLEVKPIRDVFKFVKYDSKLNNKKKGEGWCSLYGIDFRYQRETELNAKEKMMASTVIGSILTGLTHIDEIIVREYSKEFDTVEKDVTKEFQNLKGEVIDGQFKYYKSIYGFLQGQVRLENVFDGSTKGKVKHAIGGMNIYELIEFDQANKTSYVKSILDYKLAIRSYHGITSTYAALLYIRLNTNRNLTWWDNLKAYKHPLCDLAIQEVCFDPNKLDEDGMKSSCVLITALNELNRTDTGKISTAFKLRMSYIDIWIISYYFQFMLHAGIEVKNLKAWSDSEVYDWWTSTVVLHDKTMVLDIYKDVQKTFGYVAQILETALQEDIEQFKDHSGKGRLLSLIFAIMLLLNKNKNIASPLTVDGKIFMKKWNNTIEKLTTPSIDSDFKSRIKKYINTHDWKKNSKSIIYDDSFIDAFYQYDLQAHAAISQTKKIPKTNEAIGIPGLYWLLNEFFIQPDEEYNKSKHNPAVKYADWGLIELDSERVPSTPVRKSAYDLQSGLCPFSGEKITVKECNAHDTPHYLGGSSKLFNMYGCKNRYNTTKPVKFEVLFGEIHGEAGVTLEEYRRRIKDGEILWGITKKI
jgi:hypothetical protein